MSLKSGAFQGIATLNPTVADQLEIYLRDKETQSVKKILDYFNSTLAPMEFASETVTDFSTLSPALEKIIHQTDRVSWTPRDWKAMIKNLNGYFWEYLELLEEFTTEFFQQIDRESVDSWSSDLVVVIDRIKNILYASLNDFSIVINKVESQLDYFKQAHFRSSFLKKILFFWNKNLDSSLISYVEKCKKYLEFRYQSFLDRFERYVVFQAKVNQAAAKFEKYEVFSLLDNDVREKCLKIYRLVKFWELNTKIKSLPQRETILSLRSLISPDKALNYFQTYFAELQTAMYDLSRYIKNPACILNAKQVLDRLTGYRKELHTLGATLAKYRDFLLRTDPNPYVRSRLGFTEWAMGPEPYPGKEMLNLSYDIESVDSIQDAFIQSFLKKTALKENDNQEIKSDILCLLHEMGQPLISKPMMKLRAAHLLDLMEQLDELTSFSMTDVEFIEQAMIKGLRGDWKYQVLYELPKFHKLYRIHQGIMGPVKEPQHAVRLKKFKQYLHHVEQWVQKDQTVTHAEEMALNLNDIKLYLQNFLAQVQQTVQSSADSSLIQKIFDLSNTSYWNTAIFLGISFIVCIRATRMKNCFVNSSCL